MGIQNGPPIETTGLAYYVDPANTKSYVDGNTTATDLVSNKIAFLQSGTGFASINAGVFDFDGTDDNLALQTTITTSHLTYSVWYRPDTSDTSFRTLGQTGAWSTTNFACFFSKNGPGLSLSLVTKFNNTRTDSSFPTSINPNFSNSWHNATFVIEPLTQYIYYNGQYCNSSTRTINTDITINTLNIGQTMGYGPFGGQLGATMLYSRALAPNEIKQNYNAMRGRYGI